MVAASLGKAVHGLVVGDPQVDGAGLDVPPRRLRREHLHERDADAPNVRLLVELAAVLHDLGSGVVRSAHDVDTLLAADRLEVLCRAEVADLYMRMRVPKDVSRLDICKTVVSHKH